MCCCEWLLCNMDSSARFIPVTVKTEWQFLSVVTVTSLCGIVEWTCHFTLRHSVWHMSSHSLLNFIPRCLGRGYVWNKIISKLFQPLSTSNRSNFISAHGHLPYFEMISQAYCSSLICSNVFNVAEIILK